MGNDGGTIAKRQDIKSLHSKSDSWETSNPRSLCDLLTVCGLLGIDLEKCPIVSDYRGRLYSKEKVIEYILASKSTSSTLSSSSSSLLPHVKLLNDVLNVTAFWQDHNLTCPVTREFENVTYAYSRRCGCLFNSKLLKDFFKLENNSCPVCSLAYDQEIDLVFVDVNDDLKLQHANESSCRKLQELGLYHNKKPRKGLKKRTRRVDSPLNPESERTKKNYKSVGRERSRAEPHTVDGTQLQAGAPSNKKRKV